MEHLPRLSVLLCSPCLANAAVCGIHAELKNEGGVMGRAHLFHQVINVQFEII